MVEYSGHISLDPVEFWIDVGITYDLSLLEGHGPTPVGVSAWNNRRAFRAHRYRLSSIH